MANPAPNAIEKAMRAAKLAAMRDLGVYLSNRFTEEISTAKWDYPTPPQVRDIVDTGRLRASQTMSIDSEGDLTFAWPVDYAQQVHDGGVSTQTRRPFPGRPWTEAPLSEVPQKLGEYLDRRLP
jgi:hypothetical protein